MSNGYFGNMFDFDGDGKLGAIESTFDFMAFNDLMIGAEKAEREQYVDTLESAGLSYDELWYMSDFERREKLEEAGLEPDSFDF